MPPAYRPAIRKGDGAHANSPAGRDGRHVDRDDWPGRCCLPACSGRLRPPQSRSICLRAALCAGGLSTAPGSNAGSNACPAGGLRRCPGRCSSRSCSHGWHACRGDTGRHRRVSRGRRVPALRGGRGDASHRDRRERPNAAVPTRPMNRATADPNNAAIAPTSASRSPAPGAPPQGSSCPDGPVPPPAPRAAPCRTRSRAGKVRGCRILRESPFRGWRCEGRDTR